MMTPTHLPVYGKHRNYCASCGQDWPCEASGQRTTLEDARRELAQMPAAPQAEAVGMTAELAEVIDAIRYRHQRDVDYPDECGWCGEDWPCSHMQVLDALDAATARQSLLVALAESIATRTWIVDPDDGSSHLSAFGREALVRQAYDALGWTWVEDAVRVGKMDQRAECVRIVAAIGEMDRNFPPDHSDWADIVDEAFAAAHAVGAAERSAGE